MPYARSKTPRRSSSYLQISGKTPDRTGTLAPCNLRAKKSRDKYHANSMTRCVMARPLQVQNACQVFGMVLAECGVYYT